MRKQSGSAALQRGERGRGRGTHRSNTGAHRGKNRGTLRAKQFESRAGSVVGFKSSLKHLRCCPCASVLSVRAAIRAEASMSTEGRRRRVELEWVWDICEAEKAEFLVVKARRGCGQTPCSAQFCCPASCAPVRVSLSRWLRTRTKNRPRFNFTHAALTRIGVWGQELAYLSGPRQRPGSVKSPAKLKEWRGTFASEMVVRVCSCDI
jgi:hypothetical protein